MFLYPDFLHFFLRFSLSPNPFPSRALHNRKIPTTYKAMSIPIVTLRGGKKFPLQAYGTGTALFSKDCTQSVQQALSAGFTFFDLAEVYKNSQYVGQALPNDSNKDGKIQILSKIHDTNNIYKAALEEKEKLKIAKFDALLLHLPPRGLEGKPSNVEAWKIMEQLKDEGVVE